MPQSPAETGWERRFVADPARAREAIDVYTRAGFEVRTEPLSPDDLRAECASCQLVQAGLLRVIYTRAKASR